VVENARVLLARIYFPTNYWRGYSTSYCRLTLIVVSINLGLKTNRARPA